MEHVLAVLKAFVLLTPEAWLVVVVLMLPLVIGLLNGLWAAQAETRSEREQLRRLQDYVGVHLEEGQIDDIEGLEIEVKALPQNSVVRRGSQLILDVRGIASPQVEPLLEAALRPKQEVLGWLRSVPNLFMLAGLLGTVLGLAASVATLGPQVAKAATASTPDELAASLGSTLQTMQGAFGCSLWGILLALASSYLISRVQLDRGKLLAAVWEFSLGTLMPAVFPRSSEDQVDRMTRLIKNTSAVIAQFRQTLQDTVTPFQNLLDTAGSAVRQSLEGLGQISGDMRASVGEVASRLKEMGDRLADSASHLASAQTVVSSTLASAEGKLATQLGDQAKRIQEFQTAFINSSQEVVENVQRVSDSLDRTVAAFKDEGVKQMGESLKLRETLAQHFEMLQAALSQQGQESAAEDARRTKLLEGALQTIVREQAHGLAEQQRALKEMVERFTQSQVAAARLLTAALQVNGQTHAQAEASLPPAVPASAPANPEGSQ